MPESKFEVNQSLRRIGQLVESLDDSRTIIAADQKQLESFFSKLEEYVYQDINEAEFHYVQFVQERIRELLRNAGPFTVQLPPAEKVNRAKPFDINKLLKFSGKALDYPAYRASMMTEVVSSTEHTPTQMFVAFHGTLNSASRDYLATIDPAEPNIDQVVSLLDEEYLDGTKVEDAIREEVRAVSNTPSNAKPAEWNALKSVVDRLQLRVQNRTISSTAEKEFRRDLLSRLSWKDKETALLDGDDLASLAITLERFLRRARELERSGDSNVTRKDTRDFNRKESRFHPYSQQRPRENNQPRPRTFTTVPEGCFYCDRKHEMKDCPESLEVKRSSVAAKRLCWRCVEPFHKNHRCGKRCTRCGGPHHATICSGQQEPTTKNGPSTGNSATPSSGTGGSA